MPGIWVPESLLFKKSSLFSRTGSISIVLTRVKYGSFLQCTGFHMIVVFFEDTQPSLRLLDLDTGYDLMIW